MKTLTLLLLLLAGSLYAADAPKPAELPPITVEQKLAIREAQLAVARISDAMGKMAMQYTDLQAKQKESQEALEKLVKALQKPKDCPTCELSDALTWSKPKTELAKEKP